MLGSTADFTRASERWVEMSAEVTSRPSTEGSDWNLVAAAKNGEDWAFEMLVKRYRGRILSLAFHITHNREDAEDVVQQSFQNAFVYIEKFQGKSAFSTWLTRIAINEALMLLRKNRVLKTISLDEEDSDYEAARSMAISDASANPEQTCVQRENEEILSFVINKLPPLSQTAIRLYLDELTVAEIGHILGVRIPTAKGRLLRSRQKVSELFKRYMESARRRDSSNLEKAA